MSRRRRASTLVLATVFVVVPMVEIYIIVQLGPVVGPWWTIGLLVAAGFLGARLVRSEGRRAWLALHEALSSGRMPVEELADGALILVGGTLLITPGFLSDLVGLFCILPFTRPLARALLSRVIARRIIMSGGPLNQGPGRPSRHRPQRPPQGPAQGQPQDPAQGPPQDPTVVQGEVVDDDDR